MIQVEGPFSALRPVDLHAIEQELDNMWRAANADVAATGGKAFSRNSVLTLVVFTYRLEHAQRILEAVHTLTTQHPSRAIIVVADPQQAGQAIQASIGTHVGPDAASYGEDIVLEAEADAIRHLPGVILPLIVSGLPSFLWWTGEPPWGTELLEALVDGSDRLIVDTSGMRHVEQSLSALGELMRRKKTRCAISDMTWTCQSPWREITAQFFDVPRLRPYLDNIERVTIEYAAGDEDAPLNSGQAYLFAGWLASRLGWRSDPAQPLGIASSRQYALRDGSGRSIAIEINARYGVAQRTWWNLGDDTDDASVRQPQAGDEVPSTPCVLHGALMSVHIAARLNGERGAFTVVREPDLMHATTLCHVPDGAPPPQTVHLQSIGERAPLSEQLQRLGHDLVYEQALSAAAQFVALLGRRGAL